MFGSQYKENNTKPSVSIVNRLKLVFYNTMSG